MWLSVHTLSGRAVLFYIAVVLYMYVNECPHMLDL